MDNAQHDYVLAHLALVKPLARRLKRRVPQCFDIDDLIQAGMLGLIRAARDQDGRSPSDYWARFRIWHAMVETVTGEPWWWATRCTDLTLQDVAADSPEEAAGERHALLGAALATLTPLERRLVDLVYEHGVTLWTVGHARLLNIGWRTTIRTHNQALAKLRAALGARCGAEISGLRRVA